MQENNKSFKLKLFKEIWSEETGAIIKKNEKEVVLYAPTLCEAIVKAIKQNRDFTFKCVVQDV
jgi:hypothetical protein